MSITSIQKAYCFFSTITALLVLVYITEPNLIGLHQEKIHIEKKTTSQGLYGCKKLFNAAITTTDPFLKLALECCSVNQTMSWDETLSIVFSVNCLSKYRDVNGCNRSIPHWLETPTPLVALASLPGSGNTWTRQLLEYVTEVKTGSMYGDGMTNFTGSKVCPTSGKVFIVKTHKGSNHVSRKGCNQTDFSKAIYIIRNPYDAMIADFNRHKAGKIKVGEKNNFYTDEWNTYATKHANRWEQMTSYWLTTFDGPVHLLAYEYLTSNPSLEMFKILQFLDMPVQIKPLLCLSKLQFQSYYRKDKPDWLRKEVLYNNDLKATVNSRIHSTLETFQGNEQVSEVLRGYILT